MFDNTNSQPPLSGTNQTLGLQFSLDLMHKTPTLLKNLSDFNQLIYTNSQEAFNPLLNGNSFMDNG